METPKRAYNGMDLVKGLLALFVIVAHTSPFNDVYRPADFFIGQVLGRLVVPYFFVAAAFMLFRPGYDTRRVVGYALRLGGMYLIWTCVYFLHQAYVWTANDAWTARNLLNYARNFLFSGSYYVLWFFPSLITAVLLYHIAKKLLRRDWIVLTLGVGLMVAGVLGQSYHGLLNHAPAIVNKAYRLYLGQFLTTRNGVFYGFLHVALGAWLSAQVFGKKSGFTRRLLESKWQAAACFAVCFALFCVEVYAINDAKLYLRRDMYLLQAPTALFLMLWSLQMRLPNAPIYRVLRELSLDLFLTQGVFIILAQELLPNLHSLLRFGFVTIGSVALSLLFIALKHKFPQNRVLRWLC